MQHDRTNGAGSAPTRGFPAGHDGGPGVPSPGRTPSGPPGRRVTVASGAVPADALGTLRWGVRRYSWLVGVCVLAVAVLCPVSLAIWPVEYQATALVVAQRLDMDLVALPRLGEAVFVNGEVTRRVVGEFGAAGEVEDVIPNRVSLVADQDSIVFQVIGHDASPTTATALANAAAETFATQLNVPGEGVGLFAVQSRAVPPLDPVVPLPSLLLLVPIALIAGLLLGLAAVTALLVVRRPVLDAGAAYEATGIPVIGTVSVPRRRDDSEPDLQAISGVVPVCRRLLTARVRSVILVGPAGSTWRRRQLLVAMSAVLGRVRRVRTLLATEGGTAPPSDDAVDKPPELVLVDGSRPLEIVQLAGGTLTVLVVPSGTSTANLRAEVTRHLAGADTSRLLMLHEHRLHPEDRRSADATPPSSPVGGPGPSESAETARAVESSTT